ncbi:MAG: NAD-dependent epimerase/dehydratase family protein [Bacillota bacterium]
MLVREAIAGGLDAVIVFPSGVIGPYDYRLSEMGGFILDYLRGRVKVYTDGAYDFTDVRDVARGLVAAGEKGRRGEGYLLTGEVITVRGLMDLLHRLTGIKPPSLRVPRWLARAAAVFSPLYYTFARTRPRFTSYALHVLGSNCRMDSSKARRELGYSPRPLAESVADTIKWFMEMGWAPRISLDASIV